MSETETADVLFTALTFIANVGVLVVAVVALASVLSSRVRGAARAALARFGPWARVLALVVAVVATLGSLYYSEIAGYVPCELCWYQRICVYPLSAILAVGVLRRDRGLAWYALPFLVAGIPIALYHWLVERVPSLAESSSCSITVPCAVPYFEELGWVTLAFMSLSALVAVAVLLMLDVLALRRSPPNPSLQEAP